MYIWHKALANFVWNLARMPKLLLKHSRSLGLRGQRQLLLGL